MTIKVNNVNQKAAALGVIIRGCCFVVKESRLTKELLDCLRDLQYQKPALRKQYESGIIDYVDTVNEQEMISKKEFRIKQQLVNKVHIKSNGKLRSIATGKPTSSYPDGYVYTKMEGGKLIKAKDIESLYLKLYDIYYGTTDNIYSIAVIFEKALAEKRITDNPKPNTVTRYERDYRRFITEDFAKKDIRQITDIDVKAYTQNIVTTMTVKRASFINYKSLLNLIFGYAYNHGVINTNPVSRIQNSVYLKSCDCATAKAEDKILSPEEIESLVSEVKRRMTFKKWGDYYIYGYGMRFAILTGVRVGELCALKWNDVDFNTETIHIHSQLLTQDNGKNYYIVPYLKNERGISNGGRIFPLTNEIRNLLCELKEKQRKLGIQSEYIFCDETGEVMKTLRYGKFLYTLCKHFDMNVRNNHAFRMSLNSNVLIQNGVSVADRAKLLGHSVATNEKHYSFAQLDYVDKARDIMNRYSADKELFASQKELSSISFPGNKKSLQTAPGNKKSLQTANS